MAYMFLLKHIYNYVFIVIPQYIIYTAYIEYSNT